MADPLAPATRLRAALAARFKALNLPEYGEGNGRLTALDGRVYELLDVDESNLTYPCVVLTAAGLTETVEPDTNAADLVGYPIKVGVCERNGRLQHAKLPAIEYWRHRLIAAVRSQRLDGVSDILVRMGVEPAPVVQADPQLYQHLVSAFVVRMYARVPWE